MSHFRSLYVQQQSPEATAEKEARPWPAVYRFALPRITSAEEVLQVRCENQLPRTMTPRQLMALPTFTENRRITSQAGWTYYGQWKGVSFQTLFSLFATPSLYGWVRLESFDGQHYVIERPQLLNYRILLECDGTPLTPLYGGPILVHCFDTYLEYAMPHIKSIILLQGDYQAHHPMTVMGYAPEAGRVVPGDYYAIHHEKISHL